jgi:hypothetical protein
MTNDDIFSGPGSITQIDWKGLYGKLLAIFPYGTETVQTRFGEGRAVRADVYDLDGGEPVSLDALIFGKALVIQLSSIQPGKAVVGRLGQAEARGGNNPAWLLADPTPADIEKARAYFAQHPPRAVPGGAFTAQQRPAQPQQPPHQPSLQQPRQGSAWPAQGDPWGQQGQQQPHDRPPF